MYKRLIESWSSAYSGMLTDSRGTSRWRHRYWHRANLMPRADRDRYGGSVTAIPATSLRSLHQNHSPYPSRFPSRFTPRLINWTSTSAPPIPPTLVSGSPFDTAVSSPFLYFRSLSRDVSSLLCSPRCQPNYGKKTENGGCTGGGQGVGWGGGGQRTGIEFEVTSIRKRVIDMSKAGYEHGHDNMLMPSPPAIGDFPFGSFIHLLLFAVADFVHSLG